jgi:indolepyruvate ferredoxin oxidoreductase alpha subunit
MIKPLYIDQRLCERCYTCVKDFGCPSFVLHKERDGSDGMVTIDQQMCNGNGSCIQVCPCDAIKRPERDK